MRRRHPLLFAICILLLPAAAAAATGVPDPLQCDAMIGPPGPVSMLITPLGNGTPFNACSDGMGPADATIIVTIRDSNGDPIDAWPPEDIWIVGEYEADGIPGTVTGLAPCTPFSIIPDDATNPLGEAYFDIETIAGGGHSGDDIEGLVVCVSGVPVGSPPLPILFNSPDIDGNGVVDDQALFVSDMMDYPVVYHYRSDFNYDGAVDNTDLSIYAGFEGQECMSSPSAIQVTVTPVEATWQLDGPSGFFHMGQGDELLEGLEPGFYTLTWLPLDCFDEPVPNPEDQELLPGDTLVFAGSYSPACGSADVRIWPDTATWQIVGPNGYVYDGVGDELLTGLEPGWYVLTWNDLPCYLPPAHNPAGETVPAGGTAFFYSAYSEYGGTVQVQQTPDPPTAPAFNWKLLYPAELDSTFSTGDRTMFCLPPGDYELTWYGLPADWRIDGPNPVTGSLVTGDELTLGSTFVQLGTVVVDVDPDAVGVGWRLTGPLGFDVTDVEDATFALAEPGSYTLEWQEPPGWYLPCPSPEVQTLPQGGTITFNCTFLERADLTLDVTPDGIGAGWRVTGPLGFDQSDVEDGALADLAPGEYTVTWQDVPCWTTPAPNPVQVTLAPGASGTAAATWLQNGTVAMNPDPDGIGAGWHLTGPGGTDLTDVEDLTLPCMPPGEYTVQWLAAPGWILSCPEPEVQTLDPGGSIEFACTYGAAGTIVVNVDPDGLAGACWTLTGPAAWDTTLCHDETLPLLPAGTYTLEWADVPDWVDPPSPMSGVLVAEETLNFSGVYRDLPEIMSVTDVGNDDGRQLRLLWHRVLYDAPDDGVDVTGYAVYRRQDAYRSPAPDEAAAGARKLGGWDYLATVPARGDPEYQTVVPSLCDSTDLDGICMTTYMVSALTPDPFTYYDSPPDSGYSVDNLPPSMPRELRVDYDGGGNDLSWAENPEKDIREYRVYRGEMDVGQGCAPMPEEPSAVVSGNAWTDDLPGGGAWDFCYYVTAVDDAGNESAATVWSETGTTGIGGPTPTAFRLHQNAPNPFNPRTTITFDLPRSSRVRLSVYDMSGRLVAVLVDEPGVEKGRHQAVWEGRDASGRTVAAGVYVARIEAEGFAQSRRMVLGK